MGRGRGGGRSFEGKGRGNSYDLTIDGSCSLCVNRPAFVSSFFEKVKKRGSGKEDTTVGDSGRAFERERS